MTDLTYFSPDVTVFCGGGGGKGFSAKLSDKVKI